MTKNIILQASYPILDSEDVLSIRVYAPNDERPPSPEELMTHLGMTQQEAEKAAQEENPTPDRRICWALAINKQYVKEGYSIGIDDMQAMLLTMQAIMSEIERLENEIGKKCEYSFAQHTSIIYKPPWAKLHKDANP